METALYKLPDDCYALRVWPRPAEQERRLPTHFILVVDTSDSMSDNNKLANVKHSASLVLHFLGAQDYLSIITFGDDATIHAKAVRCDSDQKQLLTDSLSRIRTDGCTNLSAGIVRVQELLNGRTEEIAAIKTGILLLTDGHANRGVFGADPLRSVIRQLHETFPTVNIQVVGYGTDHNAELLKSFAEITQGTYSIVDDREGAATVIGDSLGSLFSCVAQQVSLQPNFKLELEGEQYRVAGDPPRIQIGDVYEGNETLLLFKAQTSATPTAVLQGTLLPSLAAFHTTIALDATVELTSELETTILLTRKRYAVSRLFKQLREYRLGSNRFADIRVELEAIEAQLADARFNDNPIAQMLKSECISIRNAMETLQTGTRWDAADVATRLVAHEAYTNLGRGTVAALPPRRRHTVVEEDPQNTTCAALGATSSQYMTTPSRNRMTNRVTRLMTTMSVGGEGASAAAHEAAELSQQSGGDVHGPNNS